MDFGSGLVVLYSIIVVRIVRDHCHIFLSHSDAFALPSGHEAPIIPRFSLYTALFCTCCDMEVSALVVTWRCLKCLNNLLGHFPV